MLLRAKLRNDIGQVVHTYVPLPPSSITWNLPSETSGRHNTAMITDRHKFTYKWSFYGMSCFRFLPLESLRSLSLRCTQRIRKVLTQIFGNVRRLILRIKTNSTLQCWCGLVSDILKTSRQFVIRIGWDLLCSIGIPNLKWLRLPATKM